MPIKFDKALSTHLFKYIQSIDIKFNPFDSRSRSSRELIRQVQSERYAKANPILKVAVNVHDLPDPPLAEFSFVDGSKQIFESHTLKAFDILFQVHLRTMQLDAEYEMSGKSVDDP